MITLKAYAKINLALEVMDSENGYHRVNNLMIPISIYDELTFEKNDSIIIKDDPFPGQNIIERAARLFFDYTKITGGVDIELRKNIPHAAGLAGGSTDAACTLKGLNELYKANLSDNELIELSSKLGSDVGFFINTRIALCTGRGEIINPLSINVPRLRIFLIKPDTGLSTALVYKSYSYDGISKENLINSLIKGLDNNDIDLIKKSIFNDLSKPALLLNNELNIIYNTLKKMNLNPYISGSGPTMYLVNPTDKDIEMAKSVLASNVFTCECYTF